MKWNGRHRKEEAGADRRSKHELISRSTCRIYFGRKTASGKGRLFQIKLFCILEELEVVVLMK